jgi:hypothetical protein
LVNVDVDVDVDVLVNAVVVAVAPIDAPEEPWLLKDAREILECGVSMLDGLIRR